MNIVLRWIISTYSLHLYVCGKSSRLQWYHWVQSHVLQFSRQLLLILINIPDQTITTTMVILTRENVSRSNSTALIFYNKVSHAIYRQCSFFRTCNSARFAVQMAYCQSKWATWKEKVFLFSFFNIFSFIWLDFCVWCFFPSRGEKNGQLWQEVGWCDISISETFSLVRLVPSYHFIYVIFRRLIK